MHLKYKKIDKKQKMAPRAETSTNVRSIIIALYSEGYPFRRISERLGVPKSTASDIVNRFKTTNSVENCHRSGRPPICTPRDERNLIRLVTQNRRASSTQLSHEWKLSNGKQASPSTVRKT